MNDPKAARREFLVRPCPDDPQLSREVEGIDQTGAVVKSRVIAEKPLTLFVNSREIVTMMTIGDHPDLLAVGYLLNQNMLKHDDEVTGVDYDADLERRHRAHRAKTDFENEADEEDAHLRLRPGHGLRRCDGRSSSDVRLPRAPRCAPPGSKPDAEDQHRRRASISPPAPSMAACCARRIGRWSTWRMSAATTPSTRSPAGCSERRRAGADKIFYTTGRLTSEMVIKTVQMGIPILVSRSGFTAWGVDLARQAGLTLIGRARGARFLALSGEERIVFDGKSRGRSRKKTAATAASRAHPMTGTWIPARSASSSPAACPVAWTAARRRSSTWPASR